MLQYGECKTACLTTTCAARLRNGNRSWWLHLYLRLCPLSERRCILLPWGAAADMPGVGAQHRLRMFGGNNYGSVACDLSRGHRWWSHDKWPNIARSSKSQRCRCWRQKWRCARATLARRQVDKVGAKMPTRLQLLARFLSNAIKELKRCLLCHSSEIMTKIRR